MTSKHIFCAVHAGRETLSCGAQSSPVNMGQSSARSTVPFMSSLFLSLQSDVCSFRSIAVTTPAKSKIMTEFDVLLTVHLSIILVINQLNAQNLVL